MALADDVAALPVRRVLLAGLLAAALVVAVRSGAYSLVRRARRRGWTSHPTLVLGAGRVGGMLVDLLLEHPGYGLSPVGFLDDDPYLTPEQCSVPLLGGTDALGAALVAHGITDVVVAFGSIPESHMVEIIRTCDKLQVEIFFIPRLFELQQVGRDVDQVWGIPLLRLRRPAFRAPTWRVKRLLDLVGGAGALVVLAPVLLACALAVRLDGPGSVLFRQERVGLDGRPSSSSSSVRSSRWTTTSPRPAGTSRTTSGSAG